MDPVRRGGCRLADGRELYRIVKFVSPPPLRPRLARAHSAREQEAKRLRRLVISSICLRL